MRPVGGRSLLTPREVGIGLWGVARVFALFGFQNWQTPPPQPFAGRLSWLYKFADSQWGQTVPAGVIFAFAALLFVLGLMVCRRAAAVAARRQKLPGSHCIEPRYRLHGGLGRPICPLHKPAYIFAVAAFAKLTSGSRELTPAGMLIPMSLSPFFTKSDEVPRVHA